ncbi:unnamed protein product [Calicophoron daubneyi]|uniref:Uncharacterized protein n=1 Tax=Calicophoron daubneyi TaxID=300641 RepID=A0AAV2TBN6_CALDB
MPAETDVIESSCSKVAKPPKRSTQQFTLGNKLITDKKTVLSTLRKIRQRRNRVIKEKCATITPDTRRNTDVPNDEPLWHQGKAKTLLYQTSFVGNLSTQVEQVSLFANSQASLQTCSRAEETDNQDYRKKDAYNTQYNPDVFSPYANTSKPGLRPSTSDTYSIFASVDTQLEHSNTATEPKAKRSTLARSRNYISSSYWSVVNFVKRSTLAKPRSETLVFPAFTDIKEPEKSHTLGSISRLSDVSFEAGTEGEEFEEDASQKSLNHVHFILLLCKLETTTEATIIKEHLVLHTVLYYAVLFPEIVCDTTCTLNKFITQAFYDGKRNPDIRDFRVYLILKVHCGSLLQD